MTNEEAKKEIEESLSLSFFCMQCIGFSFTVPKRPSSYYRQKLLFLLSICGIFYHFLSEFVYIILTFWNSPRIENVVPLLHTFGYGVLAVSKGLVLWYKKNVLKQLLLELRDIWPMSPIEEDSQNIKSKSLSGLRTAHRWYFGLNLSGVWFYSLTPIGIYFIRLFKGQNAEIGFVWASWYPFDKNKFVIHIFVYIFEVFSGQTCVFIMICTDLLFSGMTSHIGMLLRLLQRKLKSLAFVNKSDDEYYEEILSNIKLHQRLISYCNNLEELYSLVNLINIVFSSINICCVLFVIVLLEPFMVLSNKLFLGSSLIQIGLICWYADDIYHANADIASAAYTSSWYKTSPRCRRALLFLIQRSQKPIAFTAMKFTNISLVTYSAILTRSYSYFTLLYTMYSDN
ncbi:odorant receptor 4-like [Battus philenor]|uniref:odorant receptor 4-like n=1 Tax=Battus philenor TaxID=42288 RepID=UPI0035D06714